MAICLMKYAVAVNLVLLSYIETQPGPVLFNDVSCSNNDVSEYRPSLVPVLLEQRRKKKNRDILVLD